MHHVIRTAPAALPLRLLLITLLLAGLALAGDQHCDTSTAAPLTAVVAAVGDGSAPAHTDSHGAQHPADGLIGLCLTVLAGITAALLLLAAPDRGRTVLTRLPGPLALAVAAAGRPPALTQLGVSRT